MKLRYLYGGPGFPGNPENGSWFHPFGQFWSHEFAQRIVLAPNETHVWLVTESGAYREFSSLDAGNWYVDRVPASEKRKLRWAGPGLGWELHALDGTVTYFLANGLWDRTVDPHLLELAAGTYNAAGRLETVDLADGRWLTLNYTVSGKIATVVENPVPGTPEPARTWAYTWLNTSSIPDRLNRLAMPDGSRWRFSYDTASPPHLTRAYLEGSTGSPSRVEAAWEYDASGRIWRAWKGAETYDASTDPNKFIWNYLSPTSVEVTDGYGAVRTYTFDREPQSGRPRARVVSGTCPGCGGLPANGSLDYEDPANPFKPTRVTNGRGFLTTYTYDENGMMTSEREAVDQVGFDRTTEWEYTGPFESLVTKIEGPSPTALPPQQQTHTRVTNLAYEADGDLQWRQITGQEYDVPNPPPPIPTFDLTTYFTYTTEGRTDTIDPPGYGLSDQTDWNYTDASRPLFPTERWDPVDSIGGPTLLAWDGFNRRKSEIDPNDHKLEWTYDNLDRVKTVRSYGDPQQPTQFLETQYFYTALGDLGCVRYPAGNAIQYIYGDASSGDPAGRLTQEIRGTAVASNPSATNCIDATKERERRLLTYSIVTSPAPAFVVNEKLERWVSGTTWATDAEKERRYESSCLVSKQIDGANHPEASTTSFGYDCNGNLATLTRAFGSANETSTTYGYDPLDRLASVTQPWGGAGGGNLVTQYGHDAQDHLTSVIDGEQSTTAFLYSDRDLMTRQDSLVSGVTRYGYNEHGELDEEHQDGRSVSVFRTVDAADRVTLIDYPSTELDTSYSYSREVIINGNPVTQVGHLFAITRGSSVIDYDYDVFWRVIQDGDLSYALDSNGNRTTVAHPQDVTARFTYDFSDRPSKLELQEGTGPFVYLIGGSAATNAAKYRAFGPVSTIPFANVRTENRTYDSRYSPSAIEVVNTPFPGVKYLSWAYQVDELGDVVNIEDMLGPEGSHRNFGYQPHQRFLTCAAGPWSSSPLANCWGPGENPIQWTYDRIGNRLSESREGLSATYSYQQNGGGGNTAILSQIAGTLASGIYTFDGAGFLDSKSVSGNLIDFEFNAAGELSRVARQAGEALVLSYDGRGFLSLAEPAANEPPNYPPLGTWTDPTYSSEGRLMSLDRFHPSGDLERQVILYLGERPVAQWIQFGESASEIRYLTTDHLGTPIATFDAAGEIAWGGGFEPFGRNYLEGTKSDPNNKPGMPLRLPGQWDDPLWSDATLGADSYYNVHRWYETGTGSYTSVDPIAWYTHDPRVYSYAGSSPIRYSDRFGLVPVDCEDCLPLLVAKHNVQRRLHLLGTTGTDWDQSPGSSNTVAASTTCIGYNPTLGDPSTYRPFGKFPEQPCWFLCTGVHERVHRKMCRRMGTSYNMMSVPEIETPAYEEELKCLNAALKNRRLELSAGGVGY